MATSPDVGIPLRKSLFQPVRQLYNFFSPLAEEDALVGQGQSMLAAEHQRRAQFLLQIHYLPAQSGLRYVQDIRGP